MSEEEEKQIPENYSERAVEQEKVVIELTKSLGESPAEPDVKRLEIAREKLLYYRTAAEGNPRSRAQFVIENARSAVLGRAVTQPLS